jgi:hypothetical protein
MAAACWLLCLCVGWGGGVYLCVGGQGWCGRAVGSWGVIVGRSYPLSLICPSFLLPNGLWPRGEGCSWLISTPIPAFLSSLAPLSAHVYCAHCFHVVSTISSCALLLCLSSYTLSPFSYCLAPLLRHLGLRFLLPLSTSTVTVCSPFASTQYLYCMGTILFFLHSVPLLSSKRSFFAPVQYFCCDSERFSVLLIFNYCIWLLLVLFPCSVFLRAVFFSLISDRDSGLKINCFATMRTFPRK